MENTVKVCKSITMVLMEQLGSKTKEERFPIIVSGIFRKKVFGVLSIGHNLRGRYGETAAISSKFIIWKNGTAKVLFLAWCFTPQKLIN